MGLGNFKSWAVTKKRAVLIQKIQRAKGDRISEGIYPFQMPHHFVNLSQKNGGVNLY